VSGSSVSGDTMLWELRGERVNAQCVSKHWDAIVYWYVLRIEAVSFLGLHWI